MATEDTSLNSHRPYLIRAIREWAIDNHLTPQLLVNAEGHGVDVPEEFIEDGQIVLNISPQAVDDLEMGNEFISFSARFRGAPRSVLVPVDAVLAVFDRESRQGMQFPPATEGEEGEAPERPQPRKKPNLKLVE
ncbi:MAG TPA: ClpXP protease specificity-enhancing factor [Gammaproteobacteria bacterium]|nr:ClpXP protease specificity-enhancing factor [Gammaproteobacteria bacterium]|tara:strand:+ start:389 stop:790 length:402 start_codon:yes stop_codon:yes gene_type:complete